MDQEQVVQETEKFVKERLGGEGTGHDYWHVKRVHRNAIQIASAEQENQEVDLFTVKLAALLHDIADWKFHDGDETVGPEQAREWLTSQNVDETRINQVCRIIKDLSFTGVETDDTMETVEGAIVQDADRLDALGAIGIARCFAYGGSEDREIHNPEKQPVRHASAEEYKNAEGTSINHFHEKLLFLKDRMNTETGEQLAANRHRYMETFLEQFHAEWNGEQ